MEVPVVQQSSAGVSENTVRPKVQKYALRSSVKFKEQKPDAADLSNSSATKGGRPTSSVSKSVGVLDLSGKDKSAKPPRRLSIPAKASATPGPKMSGNVTPISETRTRRSANGPGRSETPISDISRPSSRTKSNRLSSSLYWLSQIKVSESAANHSISLGFFKLALQAGCEPLQRMQDELKSYVRRHQLAELGEPVKELFESYNISENTEQSQVSETISQEPEEGTRSSDDDVHISSSTMGAGKLKPKCLNIDSTQSSPVTESTKKENGQKNNPGSRVRGNFNKTSANTRPALDTGSRRSVKKPEKPSKPEYSKEKGKVMKQGKKCDVEQATVSPSLAEEKLKGNKENMDASQTKDSSTEVV